jgi:hypothetical protein
MIQRQKDGFAIECEACGDADETYDCGSFFDAWSLFKRLGWVAIKNGDVWNHDCPKCAKNWGLVNAARRMLGGSR